MKVNNIKNVNEFIDVLCHCKGTVELISKEGDRINLKSTLCQYLALAEMFSDAKVDDVDIIAHEPEDMEKIVEYLIGVSI